LEGFVHNNQKIIYFINDRKAIIVYAITIAENDSNSRKVINYQKGTRVMAVGISLE
jgi:hypothetical protein